MLRSIILFATSNWGIITLTLILLYLIRVIFLTGTFTKLKRSLSGKVVIVTGASAGIGKATALQLLQDGAEVIYACRNKEKTLRVFSEIEKKDKSLLPRAHFIQLNLASFKSVREFVFEFNKKFNKLDILINNAATYPGENFEITDDNLEALYQQNYFSLVLLTMLLLDKFDKKEAKILNLASFAHIQCDFTIESIKHLATDKEFKSVKEAYYGNLWSKHYHYSNSKTAVIHFTAFLGEYCAENYKHIKTVSVNPGLVYTEFGRFVSEHKFLGYVYSVFFMVYMYIAKSALSGAQSTLHCCYLEFNELLNGAYYSDCKVGRLAKVAKDKDIRDLIVKYTADTLKSNGQIDLLF